ncbi:MAG: hypothetical protein LOD94_17420 [Gammaproteobacteria bacterium]|nr:hypothetical protein [Gammaproteobacteria bacterium]
MKKTSVVGATTLATVLCFGGAFACEMPAMVDVPDGATATTEEMIEARNRVTAYLASMEEYLACVDREIAAEGEDAPEEFQALMIQRYNSAVSEMETVAAAFNEQLRAFRAANPSN